MATIRMACHRWINESGTYKVPLKPSFSSETTHPTRLLPLLMFSDKRIDKPSDGADIAQYTPAAYRE